MRVMPVMATPMMFAAAVPAQRVAYTEEAPRGCEASSSRLSQLEDRFNLLNERVNSLQTTIAAQTDILTQIKTKLDSMRQ
jgi:TolA-binding protein